MLNITRRAIDNLTNGNLSDARHLARRISHTAIINAALDLDFSQTHALAIADYLKRRIDFQTYCDLTR